ncbi:hypothetical protein [Actinomycetospora callitridis]|uniref:hypothetical protein n=1 Tax=Actinomycetospora callitridis TaxID=913944 RepID=UPI0023668A8C|nr:hypothetical protein [Actinomycetospora callitridis]MDD7919688.1 hypothetical protein [Actinomycetospora callitridis]
MSVDWGSVPDWLAGVGAVAALAFAAVAATAARATNKIQSMQIAELQEQNRRRDETERRSLASKVAVYISVGEDESGFDQAFVRFVNSGDQPIYDLTVYCFTPAGILRRSYSANSPHPIRINLEGLSVALAKTLGPVEPAYLLRRGELVAASSFRDALGLWWYRTASGELREAPDGDTAAARARESGPVLKRDEHGKPVESYAWMPREEGTERVFDSLRER